MYEVAKRMTETFQWVCAYLYHSISKSVLNSSIEIVDNLSITDERPLIYETFWEPLLWFLS